MAMNLQTTAAFAFGTIAVDGTAVPITSLFSAAQLARANRARVTNGGQAVTYRYDGLGTIVSPIGHYIAASDTVVIDGNLSIRNLQFIKHGGSSTDIYVTLEE